MDQHKGYWWAGTIIAIAGVVVALLAWLLPQSPPTNQSSGSSGPSEVGDVLGVPDELIGGWQGTATSAFGAYAVQLNLQQGAVGEYVGFFVIPVAGCRSDVILSASESNAINVEARVKSGACVSGTARFSLQANGLQFQGFGADGQRSAGLLQKI